ITFGDELLVGEHHGVSGHAEIAGQHARRGQAGGGAKPARPDHGLEGVVDAAVEGTAGLAQVEEHGSSVDPGTFDLEETGSFTMPGSELGYSANADPERRNCRCRTTQRLSRRSRRSTGAIFSPRRSPTWAGTRSTWPMTTWPPIPTAPSWIARDSWPASGGPTRARTCERRTCASNSWARLPSSTRASRTPSPTAPRARAATRTSGRCAATAGCACPPTSPAAEREGDHGHGEHRRARERRGHAAGAEQALHPVGAGIGRALVRREPVRGLREQQSG